MKTSLFYLSLPIFKYHSLMPTQLSSKQQADWTCVAANEIVMARMRVRRMSLLQITSGLTCGCSIVSDICKCYNVGCASRSKVLDPRICQKTIRLIFFLYLKICSSFKINPLPAAISMNLELGKRKKDWEKQCRLFQKLTLIEEINLII